MKFDFNVNKWFASKTGLVTSIVMNFAILIFIALEIYDGSSNLVLMLLLAVLLVNDSIGDYIKILDIEVDELEGKVK